MATNTHLISDLPVPPGEYLQEVVHELGMTQAELARRMGRPAQAINEIIKGEKAVTPDTALQLEQVVGVPAHIWTGLESTFQLVRARRQAEAQEETEAEQLSNWLKGLSYPELAEFAGLPVTRIGIEKVRTLRRYLGLSSLCHLEGAGPLRPAFRQSEKVAVSQLALAVWLRRSELIANQIKTTAFDRHGLERCLPSIRAMTAAPPPDFGPILRGLLADSGVALVFQDILAKTGVTGATYWAAPRKAVLVLTIRGRWSDIFWFSLFHELGHLLLHGKSRTFLEDGSTDPDVRHLEAEANAFAAEHLIPAKDFDGFVAATNGRFSGAAVERFAQDIGIHPGIVVGRLHHRKLVPPHMLNGLRRQLVWADESA